MNFVYAELDGRVYLLIGDPDVRYASQLYRMMAAHYHRARIFGFKGPHSKWKADGQQGPYEFARAYWRQGNGTIDLRPGEWHNLGFTYAPANGAEQ